MCLYQTFSDGLKRAQLNRLTILQIFPSALLPAGSAKVSQFIRWKRSDLYTYENKLMIKSWNVFQVVLKRLRKAKGDQETPPYQPCQCKGACKEGCPCGDEGHFCEKFCACGPECQSRYKGCVCRGGCRTRACPCLASGTPPPPHLRAETHVSRSHAYQSRTTYDADA